ncbi:MAG: hypothetical protein FWF59_09860 [Turicibacter sp.]|nr:hypothetical protein [Turicibacter sp.]
MDHSKIKKSSAKLALALLSAFTLSNAFSPQLATIAQANQQRITGGVLIPSQPAYDNLIFLAGGATLPEITFSEQERFDPFVTIEFDGSFKISPKGMSELSFQEIRRLSFILTEMNDAIKSQIEYVNSLFGTASYSITSEGVSFTQPSFDTMPISPVARTNGVNKVTFHWFGIRVSLSATTIRWMTGGISIAGIWLPKTTVIKMLQSLGVISSITVTRGIWFEVNALTIVTGRHPVRVGWQ